MQSASKSGLNWKQSEHQQSLTHKVSDTPDRDRIEQSDNPFETERAILLSYQNTPDPETMDRMRQNVNHLTSEEKELLKQSEEAVRTSSSKAGLDSLNQWKFIGMETLATQRAAKRDFNIQKDFENANAMSNDHDMGMER